MKPLTDLIWNDEELDNVILPNYDMREKCIAPNGQWDDSGIGDLIPFHDSYFCPFIPTY